MLHVPPGSLFTLAAFGILIGIGSNVWQAFTTFAAFLHLFVDGGVYQALGLAGQRTALPILIIVCGLIAISFQLSILYLVFRIEHSWKERTIYGKGMDAIRGMAVEITHQVPLVLIWGGIGFLADTVGDYTFLSLYTNSPFLLFMYGTSLYASSTIMLAAAVEYYWAGRVAWAKWIAFQHALATEAERVVSNKTQTRTKRP